MSKPIRLSSFYATIRHFSFFWVFIFFRNICLLWNSRICHLCNLGMNLTEFYSKDDFIGYKNIIIKSNLNTSEIFHPFWKIFGYFWMKPQWDECLDYPALCDNTTALMSLSVPYYITLLHLFAKLPIFTASSSRHSRYSLSRSGRLLGRHLCGPLWPRLRLPWQRALLF